MPTLFLLPVLVLGQAPPSAPPLATNVEIAARWTDSSVQFVQTIDGKRQLVTVNTQTAERTLQPAPKTPPTPPPAAKSKPRPGRIFTRDHNLWIKDGDKEEQLSRDGTAADSYKSAPFVAPNGRFAVAYRTTAGGKRELTLIESSPREENPQPKIQKIPYLKPGDPIPQPRPHLFDLEKRVEIPINSDLFPNPWGFSQEHWSADSRTFYCVYNQRGHGVVRLLAIDATTGTVKAVVNEECKTFFDYNYKMYSHHLEATNELLWMSERSGWNHIYRVDRATGKTTPVTSGEWVVRGVEHVDEERGELILRVMGFVPGQDPYYVHYVRCRLDGSGITPLTEGNGFHTAQFSPGYRYLVDSWSRVNEPPVHELRDAISGKQIAVLARADITGMLQAGITLPEPFVAPGRDGKTPMYGVIYRPRHFDPNKKYRVVEYIYAGPHNHFVAKKFETRWYPQSLADRGYIVVRVDGMGTNWRSKAFHDVCWKNLGDSGFPDRIPWIRAVAAKYPELDIRDGVGIYGGSAGGQSTVRALTEHGDFYKVGVADCGCHDNRMDKIWWNEMWMGWPVGPHYAAQSNVTNAHKITGKLLLIVGELDRNVDPSSTLQVVDALIRANRDFDMLLIPGAGHGAADTPYGKRRSEEFFLRHLQPTPTSVRGSQ